MIKYLVRIMHHMALEGIPGLLANLDSSKKTQIRTHELAQFDATSSACR